MSETPSLYPRGSLADRLSQELTAAVHYGIPIGTSSKRAKTFRRLIKQVARLEAAMSAPSSHPYGTVATISIATAPQHELYEVVSSSTDLESPAKAVGGSVPDDASTA